MERKSRNTKQKEILFGEAGKFGSFFSADELFAKAKKKDVRLGIATVYRFLKEYEKTGEIHTYSCNRKTIYSVGKKSHCHFICEKCGRIDHIEVNSIDFIKNKIHGSICHFQIDVHGVCIDCQRKNSKE